MIHLEAKHIPDPNEVAVIESINELNKAKGKVDEKSRLVFLAKSLPAPKYVTTANLVIAFILTIVFGALFSSRTPPKAAVSQEQSAHYDWSTIEEATVYEKPNVESLKIGLINANQGLNSLDETNYFIKIDFYDNNKNHVQAYVRKKQLKKLSN